jgi:hypothetical protein
MWAMASNRSDTGAASHSTAGERTVRSPGTSGSWVDDTEACTEEEVSFEALLHLRDHHPYRRRGHLQLLPVGYAQPADGGYSSCRLGICIATGVAQECDSRI